MAPTRETEKTGSGEGSGVCALLRPVLDCFAEGVLVIDPRGRVLEANQRFYKMWGIPDSINPVPHGNEALAWVVAQLTDSQAFLAALHTCKAQSETGSHDFVRLKDGRSFERIARTLIVAGRCAGQLWSFRDVNDRSSIERQHSYSQRRYQELVDSLDGIVWECDAKTMRFLFVSRQAERLLGYPIERWCNEPNFWVDIMHPDDRLWTVRFCAEQTARLMPHQMEYRLIAADGRIIWLHDLVSLVVEDGEPVRLRGVMFDITERRRLQEERDRLLSEEQAHRAAAEAAVGARDEFLSIASHELRTPITSLHLTVQSLLRLVRKSQLGQMPEQLGEALVIARRQTQRLRRLIDAMLDTSRIQAGRIELEPVEVDLSALTQEVARHFSEDLAAAGCSLCLQTAHPIKGYWDPERIEQVISNLVSNAIKYGAGSEILLRVEDQGDLARLIVRDGGIGIAREHHAKIFERFERSASARQYGGLGLGLFIARRLVQAHGGTIQVDSEEGAGSTFTVELPKGTRAGL